MRIGDCADATAAAWSVARRGRWPDDIRPRESTGCKQADPESLVGVAVGSEFDELGKVHQVRMGPQRGECKLQHEPDLFPPRILFSGGAGHRPKISR